MFAPYALWSQWSDQALDAALDVWRRSRALGQLQHAGPPDVAQTPADVAYTENKLRLLHYRPAAPARRRDLSPVLIVPSIINRYYILDLKPGRSLVEYLRDQGFDVWMMDWGTPGPEDRFVTLDDHVDGYLLNCVREVLRASGQTKLSLLGYCLGGVLTTIFAALHGETYVRNLITLASPLNFHDPGLLSIWSRKEHFPVDLVVDTYGSMPAWLLQTSFKWLRPTTELRNAWGLWERLGQPERLDDFRALNHWVEDNEHVSSPEVTLLTLPGGHVGAIVGREATGVLWPQMSDWLAAMSRRD